jgi:hypothetical protein
LTPYSLPMIWRDRIPAATLTVIAGKPGLGKSTLGVTIASELSGHGMPSVISNLEDDLSAVVRPRLDVAGANLDLVHVIPPMVAPVLPHDLERLEQLVREPEAACLILDPVAAHFRPERRVHDRAALRQLVQLARDTRCAIVGVHHTTKVSVDGSAIGAIGGPTGGLAGTARAVYVYGYDPDDEDRRALACVKVNGVDEPPALLIEHETVEYDAGGRLIEAGMLRFTEESNASAKKVLRPGRRRQTRDADCQAWLGLFLAAAEDCQRRVGEIRTEGIAAGFGWQTLRRAGVELRTEKVRVGFGGEGYWLWRLPDDHPLRVGVPA